MCGHTLAPPHKRGLFLAQFLSRGLQGATAHAQAARSPSRAALPRSLTWLFAFASTRRRVDPVSFAGARVDPRPRRCEQWGQCLLPPVGRPPMIRNALPGPREAKGVRPQLARCQSGENPSAGPQMAGSQLRQGAGVRLRWRDVNREHRRASQRKRRAAKRAQAKETLVPDPRLLGADWGPTPIRGIFGSTFTYWPAIP